MPPHQDGIELRTFYDDDDYNNKSGDGFDDDEVTGLMTSEKLHYRDEDDDDRICSGSFLTLSKFMICGLLVASTPFLYDFLSQKLASIPVSYQCPGVDQVGPAENQNPTIVEGFVDQDLLSMNMSEFLGNFRESNFDLWSVTYEEMKDNMYPWKAKYFTHFLKKGDSIYESACGIGLNLFMTLEILRDEGFADHLYVYGNEFLDVSTKQANAVFDNIAPAKSRKGMICTADSSDLGFVPSDSFDLVFTGYITPMLDPLHFDLNETLGELYSKYIIFCEADDKDWKGQTLSVLAQQRQNDWYGKWVAEMARIAKPGVPVIVEQVSERYCDAYTDWGGVNKEWWYISAQTNEYGWNVKPDSIIIEDDNLFEGRYHVFMLKNEEPDGETTPP